MPSPAGPGARWQQGGRELVPAECTPSRTFQLTMHSWRLRASPSCCYISHVLQELINWAVLEVCQEVSGKFWPCSFRLSFTETEVLRQLTPGVLRPRTQVLCLQPGPDSPSSLAREISSRQS